MVDLAMSQAPQAQAVAPAALLAPTMTPEFRFLVACAIWPPSRDRDERIRAAAEPPLDWSLVLRLARRHRITGLVHAGLSAAGVTPPDEIRTAFEREARQIALHELASAGEAVRLQRALEGAGIAPVVLKGVAVAMLAFGRLGLRYNRDIDILVRPDEVAESLPILQGAGYRRLKPAEDASPADVQAWVTSHKDMLFEHVGNGGLVELHWRLFDNPTLLPGLDDLRPQAVALAQGASVRTLPAELNLLYLCVHGAEHAWSRLKWLVDVQALVSTLSSERATELYAFAKSHGAHRAMAQALILCARLFGSPLPPEIAASRRDLKVRGLEMIALHTLVSSGDLELSSTRFGSTWMNLSHYLLADGWRYWKAEFAFDLADDSRAPVPAQLRGLGPLGRLLAWAWRRLAPTGR